MARRPPTTAQAIVQALGDTVAEAKSRALGANLGPAAKKRVRSAIVEAVTLLEQVGARIDPIERTNAMFDPGNPRTIGAFIALAMAYQDRRPLSELSAFYGAGVYALYYVGDQARYAPIKATETPIYIGSARSSDHGATTAIEQGPALSKRLAKHMRNLVRSDLSAKHFDYRALVVPTGWELAAEGHLIRISRPIWNKETGIISGFGKHGDNAETRKNTRSQWDLLHPGRPWATSEITKNRTTVIDIEERLVRHFVDYPPFVSRQEMLDRLLRSLSLGAPGGELLSEELSGDEAGSS